MEQTHKTDVSGTNRWQRFLLVSLFPASIGAVALEIGLHFGMRFSFAVIPAALTNAAVWTFMRSKYPRT
jgi:hypothetical protein